MEAANLRSSGQASTPPARNSRLPDIGLAQRQAYSAPPEFQQQEDPLFKGKHSKLYQRRREVEAELRREFNLPEEAAAVLSDLGAQRAPAAFGRPPPVPKPRAGKSRLPPIPKPAVEPPRPRWGIVEELKEEQPGSRSEDRSEGRDDLPWWKVEQQRLSERDVGLSEPPNLPSHWPDGSARSVSPTKADREILQQQRLSVEQAMQQRPHSWRTGRSSPSMDAENKEPNKLSPSKAIPPESRFPDLETDAEADAEEVRGPGPGPREEPWQVKARELEEVARAHRLRHEEEKQRREAAAAQAAAAEQEIFRAAEEEQIRRARRAEERARELRQREEQRFEEMKSEELRRVQKEREEAEKRRQEQEAWEQDFRRRFEEEAQQLRAAQQRDRENQDVQQQEQSEEARRQQEEREHRRRREEAARQRQHSVDERQRLRRQAEAKPRSVSSPHQRPSPSPGPPPAAAPHPTAPGPQRHMPPPPGPSSRPSQPGFKAYSPGTAAPPPSQPSRSYGPSAPPHWQKPTFAPSPGASSTNVAGSTSGGSSTELQAAKAAAMRQMLSLKQHPGLEARQKGFKDLLRAWHPDKNPKSQEVATAVFQMLQAERGRVLES
eukprot:TRINITY_DN329_c0_g1_i1.p1 TRINITY_DN329_c0_g1~~TRINITY_DN329_c0_g1_i1.p1  ORF type:complete len:606 (-),score=174.25 TRINITY_DN329_c0_g1_i1:157-1974(-)